MTECCQNPLHTARTRQKKSAIRFSNCFHRKRSKGSRFKEAAVLSSKGPRPAKEDSLRRESAESLPCSLFYHHLVRLLNGRKHNEWRQQTCTWQDAGRFLSPGRYKLLQVLWLCCEGTREGWAFHQLHTQTLNEAGTEPSSNQLDSVRPGRYLSQLGEISDMILAGAPEISEHQKNYFLDYSLPRMAKHLIARRWDI